jgi:hypothetical protein
MSRLIERLMSTRKGYLNGSKQEGTQIIGSTSITEHTDVISSNHDTTNNNNGMKPILEKIVEDINHTNAVLEQVQTDFKADIAAIKNALSIDRDRSSSSEVQSAGDAL